MARKVEAFPTNYRKYDWDALLDGNLWELQKGEDFTLAPNNMRSSVYAAAAKRGLKARASINGDTLTLQAYTPNGAKTR